MHSDLNLPGPRDEAVVRAAFDPSPESRTLLEAALGDERPRTRVLALRGVVRHGVVTTDQWRLALGDPDAEVRREALTLVTDARPEVVVMNQVLTLCNDADPLVAEAAAFALGEFTFPAALGALMTMAQGHDDARCREAAVAALGALGLDEARPVIIAALEDKPPVRRRAIVALANFEGPDIEAALERASTDRDWQVRAAVTQLGREPD